MQSSTRSQFLVHPSAVAFSSALLSCPLFLTQHIQLLLSFPVPETLIPRSVFYLVGEQDPQLKSAAPPVSTASISARVRGTRRNRSGRSLRSKATPRGGSTGPRCAPVCAPIVLRSGPCCWAWSRYELKVGCELPLPGSKPVGEAGCGCGVWSMFEGIVRRPINLIRGARSAACAAWRIALVAYIVK